jgi:hypothetical protein
MLSDVMSAILSAIWSAIAERNGHAFAANGAELSGMVPLAAQSSEGVAEGVERPTTTATAAAAAAAAAAASRRLTERLTAHRAVPSAVVRRWLA